MTNIAIEHNHRNSVFFHWTWWFSVAMFNYQRVNPHQIPWNHHFPMVFPWVSHVFTMAFPWLSHGFPMVLIGFMSPRIILLVKKPSGLSRRSTRRTAVRGHGHHSYGSGGMLESWKMGDFNQRGNFSSNKTCKNWALDWKNHLFDTFLTGDVRMSPAKMWFYG